MNPPLAVAVLLGAGIGIGLLLITLWWRGETTAPAVGRPRLRWWPAISPRDAGVALVGGVLAGVFTGWVVGAVLVAVAVATLPRVLRRDPDTARRVARIDAIAGWTEMLRDTLSAAAGLQQAILATAPTAPQAVRTEIGELAARLRRGEQLPDALRELADELADPTADLVLAALVMACAHPTRNLAALLGELAGEAREQVSMRLRVETGRARIRTSVRVIVATTVLFATGLLVANRPYLAPYDSALGQLMLLVVGVLFGLAFWWLARVSALPGPERFLTRLDARHDREASTP